MTALAHRRILLPIAIAGCLGFAACGSTDVDELRLPVSTQSEPAQPTDFVLTLRHESPSHIECTDSRCAVHSHWIVDARSRIRGSTLADGTRFEMGTPSSLSTVLRNDVERTPSGPGWAHEGTVSVCAAADTPMAMVAALIRSVGAAHAYRVEFAVRNGAGEREPRRLATPLPVDVGGSFVRFPVGAWVRIGRYLGPRQRLYSFTERSCGLVDADQPPADMRVFDEDAVDEQLPHAHQQDPKRASTSVDDTRVLVAVELVPFLHTWRIAKEALPDTPGVEGVVAWDDATLQEAIELIDAFRAAGIQQVSFAAGLNFEKK